MSAHNAAELLIYLGRILGPALGYDLLVGDAGGVVPVALLADDLVPRELKAEFAPEHAKPHPLTSLQVSPRDPGMRVCRIAAIYPTGVRERDLGADLAARAVVQHPMWAGSNLDLRPADATWTSGVALRIPVGRSLLIPVPDLFIFPAHMAPSAHPEAEAAIAAILHAAIATPMVTRDVCTPGLVKALEALICYSRAT